MVNDEDDYNLDTLRRGLVSIRENIRNLEKALQLQRDKEAEYLGLIAVAEATDIIKGKIV